VTQDDRRAHLSGCRPEVEPARLLTSVGTCTVPSRLRPRRDSGTVRPIAGMLSVTGVDRATPTGTAVVGGPAADGTAPVRTGPGSDWRCHEDRPRDRLRR